MKLSRAQTAVLLGAAFLTGSAVIPWSSAYLATVGWILLLAVAPVFAVMDRGSE